MRKQLLKECIKNALSQSEDYAAFAQEMKAKGYRIIQGRWISVVDDKKLKVKGSAVNFSLQTMKKNIRKTGKDSNKKENIISQLKEIFPLVNLEFR